MTAGQTFWAILRYILGQGSFQFWTLLTTVLGNILDAGLTALASVNATAAAAQQWFFGIIISLNKLNAYKSAEQIADLEKENTFMSAAGGQGFFKTILTSMVFIFVQMFGLKVHKGTWAELKLSLAMEKAATGTAIEQAAAAVAYLKYEAKMTQWATSRLSWRKSAAASFAANNKSSMSAKAHELLGMALIAAKMDVTKSATLSELVQQLGVKLSFGSRKLGSTQIELSWINAAAAKLFAQSNRTMFVTLNGSGALEMAAGAEMTQSILDALKTFKTNNQGKLSTGD
jgi:hypothetical protein